MRYSFGITVAFLNGLFVLAVEPAQAQSFDCAKARAPQELLICATPTMRALDSELGAAFSAMLARLSEAARFDVRRGQREWLTFWPTSCREARAPLNPHSKDAQACAGRAYQERLGTLRADTLLAEGIRLYPSSRYLIGRSTAAVEHMPFAHATRDWIRVDVASVPPDQQPLALAIDQWLQAGISGDFVLDPEAESETNLAFVPTLPFLLTANVSQYFLGHGAAHPVSTADQRHFNLSSRRPMTPSDIFARPGWQESLTAHVERALRQELQDMYTKESSAELRELVVDPGRWSFDRDHLPVQFDVYEVAPYAAGPSTVAVPWSAVAPWLAEPVRRVVAGYPTRN